MKYLKYLFLIQGLCCIVFFYQTNGLGYWDESQHRLVYVRELMSSGSDDDVAIVVMGAFSLLGALVLTVLQALKVWRSIAITLAALFYVLQLMSLVLIQMGSIWDTIWYARNLFLLLNVTAQVVGIVLLLGQSFVSAKS